MHSGLDIKKNWSKKFDIKDTEGWMYNKGLEFQGGSSSWYNQAQLRTPIAVQPISPYNII